MSPSLRPSARPLNGVQRCSRRVFFSGPGQIAPGAETVGQAQILTALGQAFTLEGLFGEADQQALPDSMEVEDEAQAMDGIDAAQG